MCLNERHIFTHMRDITLFPNQDLWQDLKETHCIVSPELQIYSDLGSSVLFTAVQNREIMIRHFR